MVGWFLQTGRGLLQVHISFRDFIAVTAAIVTVVGSTVVFHPPFIPWVKGVMVVYSVLAFLLFLFGFLTHFRLQESKHRWIRNIHSVIPKVIKVSPLNACLLMLASASLLFISLLWPTPDKRQIAQQMLNDRGMFLTKEYFKTALEVGNKGGLDLFLKAGFPPSLAVNLLGQRAETVPDKEVIDLLFALDEETRHTILRHMANHEHNEPNDGELWAVSRSGHAQTISSLIYEAEEDVYFRDRLPDQQTPFQNDPVETVTLFDWNFPELVNNSKDGAFGQKGMPENFSTVYQVPDSYIGMPVAIIGAGAAGLAAGYELMKIGLKPVFYEIQEQLDIDKRAYARPYGRIYSWDFSGNGELDPAGAGWYPTTKLTPSSVKPNENNTHKWGRRVAELGGMRFPATHLTLRTYCDSIFRSDYFYGSSLASPWVPFRDPGLYKSANVPDPDRGGVIHPSDEDTLVFDTVYHTKGIFKEPDNADPPQPGGYSETYRAQTGIQLNESNLAIQTLTYKYFDLLYGDIDANNPYKGILTPILQLYSRYTASPDPDLARVISFEWQQLINRFDQMSLAEVLIEAGWQDEPAYGSNWGDLNISLSEMFGEIGTGTGPFAMFYYSTFMELLRIALQAADSNQDYFLGGAGYQLQPFLTHFTDSKLSDEPTCLWNVTQDQVVTDKVISINRAEGGGISVTTQNDSLDTTSKTYTAVIVTASPSSLRASEMFPNPDGLIPSRAVSYIKRVRINNNSKIAINFPNIKSEENSAAFWMQRDDSNPNDANNDLVVTTLTDKTIRQIYTFDNYHWATEVKDTNKYGSLNQSGILMLNYGWDYNAQSWTADDVNSATRKAWRQMTDIYGFGSTYDQYLEWALANNQAVYIVWEKVDGFNGAWRMAQPGRGTSYGPLNREDYSEFRTMQTYGMTSYNYETSNYTGLFFAGEASASPGLSGWVEGSIQTALQSVGGILKYLNDASPTIHEPSTQGVSFALHAHPGDKPLT